MRLRGFRVEQYNDFARSLADRFAVMKRGELVAQGSAQAPEARQVIGAEVRL